MADCGMSAGHTWVPYQQDIMALGVPEQRRMVNKEREKKSKKSGMSEGMDQGQVQPAGDDLAIFNLRKTFQLVKRAEEYPSASILIATRWRYRRRVWS